MESAKATHQDVRIDAKDVKQGNAVSSTAHVDTMEAAKATNETIYIYTFAELRSQAPRGRIHQPVPVATLTLAHLPNGRHNLPKPLLD